MLRFSFNIRGRDRRRAFFPILLLLPPPPFLLGTPRGEGGGGREGSSNTKGLDLERGIGEGTREMNRWQ